MPALIRARRQGKRVVLIESCAADMDVYCDQTILIRPGTDGALALAMMHVMEEENLADRDFLTRQAEGYEAFRKTLAPYTPAWAEKETGIPAEVIEGLAREYALAQAPAIILGSGPSRYGNGGKMCIRDSPMRMSCFWHSGARERFSTGTPSMSALSRIWGRA